MKLKVRKIVALTGETVLLTGEDDQVAAFLLSNATDCRDGTTDLDPKSDRSVVRQFKQTIKLSLAVEKQVGITIEIATIEVLMVATLGRDDVENG